MKLFTFNIKIYLMLLALTISANANSCLDSALIYGYSNKTEAQYTESEGEIAESIGELTSTIKIEINKVESSNLNHFNNLNSLKEAESLTKLKNNFYRKQQNELQGISNSIKAQ